MNAKLCLKTLLLLLAAFPVASLAQRPRGDDWLPAGGSYPDASLATSVNSNFFTTLRAEGVAGKMRASWSPQNMTGLTQVVLHASIGRPGHWPARDWQSYPMTQRERQWAVFLPVEDLEEPVIYFVHSLGAGAEAVSPMRRLLPREAGLEEPTRPFWPFLEGFEEGLESWRLLSAGEGMTPLETTASAKTGRAALLARLPAGKKSLTLATTRVRGWLLEQRQATGVCLWLRTAQGKGRARFTIIANAFTSHEIARPWSRETQLDERWQRVDLDFDELAAFPVGATDLFSIEFIAESPRELVIDDLQLLGPWTLAFP